MQLANPNAVCATGTNRPVIASGTPTLQGAASDVDTADGADQIRINAEVWPISGTSPAVSGTSSDVAPDNVASWAVPSSSALADGTYKWRMQADDHAQTSSWSDFCEFTVNRSLAAAFAEADKFFRAGAEHLVGASPTPTEPSIHTTAAGAAAFGDLSALNDSTRAADAAAGSPATSVSTSLLFAGGITQTADSLSFTPGVTINEVTNVAGVQTTTNGGENWTVGLKLVGGQWMVDTATHVIVPDEGGDTVDPNIPVDTGGNTSTGNQGIVAPSYTGLNKANAAAYAIRWSARNGLHNVWFGLNPQPNDCAAFVSESLEAGGWQESTGAVHPELLNWYSVANPAHLQQNSRSWQVSASLLQVMRNRGGHLIYKSPSPNQKLDQQYLQVGDVIQYDFGSTGHIGHTLMVTKKVGSAAYISQHTDWYQNLPYTESWAHATKNGQNPNVTEYVWRL